jgi:hypothetical protein
LYLGEAHTYPVSTPGAFSTVSPSGSDAHWRVAASATPILLLSASQDERAHASIFNHSVNALYLKFGGSGGMATSGSTGIFNVKLTSGSLYELPKPIWQGEIWGAWDAAGGFALVVELGDAD